MEIKEVVIIFFVTLLPSFTGIAQQLGYSQYFTNLPAENPGFTGIDDFLDFKVGSRQGWNDFSDPNSSVFVSAYGMLNKPLKQMVRNNALRISDHSVFENIKTNKKLRRKHGLGGLIRSTSLGPYQNTEINVNYAYHLPISRKFTLAFGTRVGVDFERVDFSNFTVRDDINDVFYRELINSNEGTRNTLVTDFGTVLYGDDIYFAISTSNIVDASIGGDDLLDNTRLVRYQFQMSKIFKVSENITMNVGGQGFVSEGYDPYWGVNARLRYKDFVYMGAAYEDRTKMSVLVGLMSAGKFSIHYSYNTYLAELSSFSVNSHEITLGVFIFNKYGANSKFW